MITFILIIFIIFGFIGVSLMYRHKTTSIKNQIDQNLIQAQQEILQNGKNDNNEIIDTTNGTNISSNTGENITIIDTIMDFQPIKPPIPFQIKNDIITNPFTNKTATKKDTLTTVIDTVLDLQPIKPPFIDISTDTIKTVIKHINPVSWF